MNFCEGLFSNNGRYLHHPKPISLRGFHFTNFLRNTRARLDRRDGVANRCF
jgi:hypothetical protein